MYFTAFQSVCVRAFHCLSLVVLYSHGVSAVGRTLQNEYYAKSVIAVVSLVDKRLCPFPLPPSFCTTFSRRQKFERLALHSLQHGIVIRVKGETYKFLTASIDKTKTTAWLATAVDLAIGETVILLHPPIHLVVAVLIVIVNMTSRRR